MGIYSNSGIDHKSSTKPVTHFLARNKNHSRAFERTASSHDVALVLFEPGALKLRRTKFLTNNRKRPIRTSIRNAAECPLRAPSQKQNIQIKPNMSKGVMRRQTVENPKDQPIPVRSFCEVAKFDRGPLRHCVVAWSIFQQLFDHRAIFHQVRSRLVVLLVVEITAWQTVGMGSHRAIAISCLKKQDRRQSGLKDSGAHFCDSIARACSGLAERAALLLRLHLSHKLPEDNCGVGA